MNSITPYLGSLAVVLLLASPAPAQTITAKLSWNMSEAIATAQGFSYALKDGTAPAVPLAGVICTTVATATQCSATIPAPTSGTHSYTLTATSALGSATSDPLVGATPGKPVTITITITIM